MITTASGEQVFSGKRNVNRVNDSESYRRLPSEEQNVLNLDLSTFSASGQKIDAEGNVGHGKLNKEQLTQIRAENARANQINQLIPQLHSALDVRDWPQALSTLKQLIGLDAGRWQFYQNLGTVQANLYHDADAAAAFEKAAELTQKLAPNAQDRSPARDELPGILLAAGDAYTRLNKLEEALSAYRRSAAASQNPSVPLFHACNAQNNHGNFAAAIDLFRQSIQADGSHWEFYQSLAIAQKNAGNDADALATDEQGIAAARKQLEEEPGSPLARNGLGQMLNAAGNLYNHAKKYDQAIAAFKESASFSAYAALPLSNLCAAFYNANRLQDAVAACDKAIGSDPDMSDPYFVKASALLGTGHVDHGIYHAPTAVRDLLNKYLGLAPAGEHAAEARALLEELDDPISTTTTPRR